MRALLTPVVRWFGQRSIKTQILWVVLAPALVGWLLVGIHSYDSHREQAHREMHDWAQALTTLTAKASTDAVLERDYGNLELLLIEILRMPGVQSVDVVRPGAQHVIHVGRDAEGQLVVRYPMVPVMPPASTGSERDGSTIRARASLLGTSASPAVRADGSASRLIDAGWVDLQLDYSARLDSARTTWIDSNRSSLLLMLLALTTSYLFLRRAIEPVRQLSGMSNRLATEPGTTLRMRWGSREVRELGRAVNRASQQIAEQIEHTRRRLSRLRAIVDTAADAIIGVRPDGRIDSINRAAARMFGRPPEELEGAALADVIPGLDAARLQDLIDNGILIHSTQSRLGQTETQALRQEGTAFPVELLIGQVPDDPEIRYTCIVRDLTDMKQAEEYLTLYGRVLDCSPHGVAVSNARRHPQPIVHVNPAFTRITGYAPHEILGRDAGLFNGPLTDPDDLALLERTLREGGETKLTLQQYRKDGTLFHNKLSVSPVRDASGEITHCIHTVEDVSGQVEVKQRLIERTARLNATFELSPDGFAVFDKSGELITSNPSFRAMVGDIPGWCSLQRFDSWFRTLCDDVDNYRPIEQALKDQRKDVISIVRPSPKVLEREIRKNLGGSGETILYLRDVTHQVEVDRIKSEFLATAAHELRTPLASILGFTELMLHRPYSEEKRKDLLQTVHRQGTLLQNLIQELLDLSRIEARQGKDFHIVPAALGEIVEAALTGISHRELGRQVQVGTLPALTVMADASKIEQALVNLLSNAFKYSPNGGEVSLSVREALRDGEPHAVVSVQDQGMGMTPEQLARAFERFYRADTSGNIPGTGLGLNLVKEIAEIHGGTVELSSEPGVGTVASLWLRLAGAVATEAPAATATTA